MKVKLIRDFDKLGNQNIYLKDAELYVTDIFPWSEYYIYSFGNKAADNICICDMIAKDICEVIE